MQNLNSKIKQKQADLSTGCLIPSGSKPSTTTKHHFHLRSSQVYVDSTDQQQISYKITPNSDLTIIISKSNQKPHDKINETKAATSIANAKYPTIITKQSRASNSEDSASTRSKQKSKRRLFLRLRGDSVVTLLS